MEMTGGEALARQLAREGVKRIFGLPGVQLDWALDGLHRIGRTIPLTVPRHEQATSYMADGYARTTGDVGVCMMVPGPGLLNAMAGLATAYSCSSPVLCITGQIHSKAIGKKFGLLHEVNDQTKTLGTVTKWNALASTPQEIPGMVREAFRQLRSGRPRPVGLEIAYDVLWSKADIELVDPAVGEEGRTEPDAAAVTKAAAMLSNARFPVIYVGGGVHAAKAYEPLRILAERIQAPVVMSDNGRGAISDRHPLALSTLGGRAVLPHSDVVLVVGSRFMEALFPNPVWSSANTRFIFLNADEADFSAPRQVDVKLYGDASLGLDALAAGVRPTTVSRAADMDKVRAWCAQQFGEIEPLWRWLRAVRDAIPDDGILVNELTQVGYLARVAYPVYAPGTFITHGYQGALGYGFATALGVATGNPGRAVVSITGDGGFGWNMQELATLKKYNLDLVTVIFNDGEFGNVRSMQQAEFGYSYAVDLCNPDFGKLADAFGVPCVSVDTPEALQSELVAALRRKGPALIEVKVGVMPNPWHLLRLKTQMKRPSPEPANPLAGGHS